MTNPRLDPWQKQIMRQQGFTDADIDWVENVLMPATADTADPRIARVISHLVPAVGETDQEDGDTDPAPDTIDTRWFITARFATALAVFVVVATIIIWGAWIK